MAHGIHHITAIASNAQENYDFYARILGLRLVKKTVNQDDVGTYHLFFGDKTGEPGMDLTFFIFQPPYKGTRGNGLVTKISFAIPRDSLSFWRERLKQYQLHYEVKEDNRILFFDRDDQQLELIGVAHDAMSGEENIWETDEVSKQHAIRHFYSATLSVEDYEQIRPVLTDVFRYKEVGKEGNITTFEDTDAKRANRLEVDVDSSRSYGVSAAGTVHHIAFRAKNEQEQLNLAIKAFNLGLQPTQVIDRYYFKSVYFRTPAGILFEIATDRPGFTVDEREEMLGQSLALPPFLEERRIMIEKNLPPLNTQSPAYVR